MKKSLLQLAGAALLALSAATFTKADPIVGEIDLSQFGSYATVDFTNQVISFNPTSNNAIVGYAAGDYAGLLGTSATYLSFSYAATAVPETIWRINATTYFVLDTFTHFSTSSTPAGDNVGVSLWGTGTIYLTGSTPTAGEWTFSSSTTAGNTAFNFSSTNTDTRSTPDSGTTALLVGVGLVGMSFMARRRK